MSRRRLYAGERPDDDVARLRKAPSPRTRLVGDGEPQDLLHTWNAAGRLSAWTPSS
jgi:hypothetical protein